jgi:hypothetical protein
MNCPECSSPKTYRKSRESANAYCNQCGHLWRAETNQQKTQRYQEIIRYWYENNITPDILIWLDKSTVSDILEDIDQHHPQFKDTNYTGTLAEILRDEYEACYREP